jgi:hypothetical protein
MYLNEDNLMSLAKSDDLPPNANKDLWLRNYDKLSD